MNILWFTSLLCICLFIQQGQSLKCRSARYQTNTQYRKILQICKRRVMGRSDQDGDSDSNSRKSDFESDSNSAEDIFDKKYFLTKNDESNNNNYRSRAYGGYGNYDQNYRQSNFNSNSNHREWNRRNDEFTDRNYNNHYNNSNNNNGRDQSCVIQCFLNELNVVDAKGFPNRDSVTRLMIDSVRDPELKDFLVESIYECFQYLEGSRRDKCEYSQNLLSCLAEKGKEKCEDWQN